MLQYQRTFQPVCQSLRWQIQVDLAARMDTARVDTTEQRMQQAAQTDVMQQSLCWNWNEKFQKP